MTGPSPTPAGTSPPATYITPEFAGIGGVIKQRPEDFLVEEIPLYEPTGQGEHIYLFVEKRELTTQQMISILARHFGVDRRAIGYAGMKDKRAITRQLVSIHVPARKIENFPMLQHDRITVLWADYHTNKLRIGHLKGNRFSIRVRGTDMSRAVTAVRVLERLRQVGVPNRIGEQRFGILRNNDIIGRLLIIGDDEAAVRELLGPSDRAPSVNREARELYSRGEYDRAREAYHHSARAERSVLTALARGATPAKAMARLDPVLKGFFLSAFQSVVFNTVLTDRLAAATFDSLVEGDLAMKHPGGAVFTVDAAVAADPATRDRLRTFEISPSGPLWGVAMKRATGPVGDAELAALRAHGVQPEDLDRFDRSSRDLINGVRRPLRIPIESPEVEGGIDQHGHYVRCAFDLPKGSFATVVMDEVIKPATLTQSEASEPSSDDADPDEIDAA